MSIYKAGCHFSGPDSLNDTDFSSVGGAVYIITDRLGSTAIDVGETGDLADRLDGHERKSCWERELGNSIYVLHHQESSKATRLDIEKKIRDGNEPPCGDS